MFVTETLMCSLFLITVHGELTQQAPEPSNDYLHNLVYLVLTGVFVDWLRIKFMPTSATEKLGSNEEKMSNQVTSFETSKPTEEEQTRRSASLDQVCEEQKKEIILKEQTVQNLSIDEKETIELSASFLVSTFNVEPKEPQEATIPFEEIEQVLSNLNKPRPRFYSDPTGREDCWDVFASDCDDVPKRGERTPETTPEMSPPTAICKPDEIPTLTEPGSTQEVTQQWLLPEEEKINERKPMVFIGGVSASTTPMEVVYELKQQGFNVTVVPRIRYGVSFGFCPDLVLSSEGEVEALLAMKKVWIKDRWIDVRPYVPKEEEELAADTDPVILENVEDSAQESTQEVNENVFAQTSDIAISTPGSDISTPQLVSPPETPGEVQHYHTFNGYDSMASTPTFIPAHTIPAPMMFPIPPGFVFTPQFPEYTYQDMHQSLAYDQEMIAVPANY